MLSTYLLQAAISDAFKTPEILRMFALAQPDHLRDRLGVIERFECHDCECEQLSTSFQGLHSGQDVQGSVHPAEDGAAGGPHQAQGGAVGGGGEVPGDPQLRVHAAVHHRPGHHSHQGWTDQQQEIESI